MNDVLPATGAPQSAERAVTLLLVEDESTLARAVRFTLERAGYQVQWAADGVAALDLFRRAAIDLVVLDLLLPQLDGLAVCQAIRRTSAVPILMLTAKTTEDDKVVGLETGADDYMTKPFGMRELIARVRALLRRAEGPAADATARPISIDDLLIWPYERRVARAGRAIDLRPREFDLLLFLARHRKQVFTRDQLLQRVWGFDFEGISRTVDVHIHLLREKVEQDPSQPALIHTVRRVGYSLG